MTTASKKSYSGIWPALVTPFDERGNIDFGCYRELIEWYATQGVGGLFAVCLSSEMHALTASERFALIDATVDTSAGRLPVAASISQGESFEADLATAREMFQRGADAVVLTPPAFCESDESMGGYFLEFAEAVDGRLGLYECPIPKKRLLPLPLVERLARTGRFHLFKETSCRLETIAAKVEATRDSPLAILQADAGLLVKAGRAGADGSINVVANVVPRLAATLWNRLRDGEDVQAMYDALCLAESLRMPGRPLGVKYLLRLAGFPITLKMRAPAPALGDADCRRIDAGWRSLSREIDRLLSEGQRAGTAEAAR